MTTITEFLTVITVLSICIVIPFACAGSRYYNVALAICSVVVFALIGAMMALGV